MSFTAAEVLGITEFVVVNIEGSDVLFSDKQLRTLPPVVVVNFILHRVSDYPFPIIHVTKPG